MIDLSETKILVVGDIMLDHYICGNVERISPEAPVPILKVTNEYSTLGGCGNVARNIRQLGPIVVCLSAHGTDSSGNEILELLQYQGISSRCIKKDEYIKTTKKTRVVSGSQEVQMLRIDDEFYIEYDLSEQIKLIPNDIDLIVVSDYNKGVVTKELMDSLRKLNKPIIIDPKIRKDSEILYDKVFMITPNKKEFENMIMPSNVEFILKTLGEYGMELIGYGDNTYIQSTPVPVFNVSGAGDTVVAILAICIANNFDVLTSAKIANDCAKYVVSQKGTSVVSYNIFQNIMEKYGCKV